MLNNISKVSFLCRNPEELVELSIGKLLPLNMIFIGDFFPVFKSAVGATVEA